MKKILLIVSIISVLFLAGCNTKQNVNNDVVENNEENVNNQNTYSGDGNVIFENDSFVIVGTSAPEDAWYTPNYQIVTLDSIESGKFVIKYSWNSDVHYYINGNIVSLLVIAPYENGTDCYVYNIDVLSKKEISNKELIELAKADYSKCLEKVKQVTLDTICTNEVYNELKTLSDEVQNGIISFDDMMTTMAEKYQINTDVNSVIMAYEEESKKDASMDLKFYLNKNGDICFVKKYTDNQGSQSLGEYMYNLTKDEVIDEFDVYAG